MKLSIELKPAPTWNVPVGFSVTSMLTMILSGDEPCSVDTSSRSSPRAVLRHYGRARRTQLARQAAACCSPIALARRWRTSR